MEGLWKWYVKMKKADMSQKLHYVYKQWLTSSQTVTFECGHHALESCEPASVHKKCQTTEQPSPLPNLPGWNWERSLEISQGWDQQH